MVGSELLGLDVSGVNMRRLEPCGVISLRITPRKVIREAGKARSFRGVN
jgi:hypothetical protein